MAGDAAERGGLGSGAGSRGRGRGGGSEEAGDNMGRCARCGGDVGKEWEVKLQNSRVDVSVDRWKWYRD